MEGVRKPVRVEDILSSKGRVKLLKVLVQFNELNISEVAKKAGLNHSTTARHLEGLKGIGVVEEKDFGRIRIFRLRKEDPKAQAIKRFFNSFLRMEE